MRNQKKCVRFWFCRTMSDINYEYPDELAIAKERLADLQERGTDAIGENWEDVRRELFKPEELAASDLRVGLMIELSKARHEKGLSQRKLEELSGVKQPVIARMENGTNSPQLDTVLKVLGALGKTLYIGDLQKRGNYQKVHFLIVHFLCLAARNSLKRL